MATPNHTAPARPSLRNEPESDVVSDLVSDIDLPLGLRSGAQHAQENVATRLTGAMLGVAVIQGLLDRWLAEQHAYARGLPSPRLRPLTVKQASGLNAALRILREHRARVRFELIE